MQSAPVLLYYRARTVAMTTPRCWSGLRPGWYDLSMIRDGHKRKMTFSLFQESTAFLSSLTPTSLTFLMN